MNNFNKFIVIEGLDGSGKSTQLNLLRSYLEQQKLKYKDIHFPMLNKGYYGKLIAEFLRGEFGDIDQVHPKLVATLFAEDRKEHIGIIKKWLKDDYIVIADRYVISNIAFQCAKCKDQNKKKDLKNWILDFEYEFNKLPKANKTVFLDVPLITINKRLSDSRIGDDRAYLKGNEDIHEKDISFQEKVRNEYLNLVDEIEGFIKVECFEKDGVSIEANQIHEKIKQVFNL